MELELARACDCEAVDEGACAWPVELEPTSACEAEDDGACEEAVEDSTGPDHKCMSA